MSLILSLMDTIVSLVVKVLWKLISLICFRVYLEVNVHKNPTCFSRWSVSIRYSWGDVEEAIDCKSFKKAWKKMKKLAMFEAETVSQEYEYSVPLIIEYDKILHKGIITLNYTYDNTTCIYEIVRTGK